MVSPMHGHGDITELAFVVVVALVGGLLLTRLRQPAILGYILCGVVLGPSLLGLIENREGIQLMAELGVLMLLFILGLELKVSTLMQVWRIALGATAIQVAGSMGVMLLARDWLGLPLGQAVLLAFALALSSTAVVIKLLEQIGALQSRTGRIIVGILIAQDMAVAPMIMTLNGLAGEGFSTTDGIKVAGSVAILIGLVLYLARRPLPLPLAREASRHKDLVPLAGLGFCFGAAALAGAAELSAGYGAFLAGLILGNSDQAETFEHGAQPIQSVLLMVFFLSVGLLLDLTFLVDNLGPVLFLVGVVVVFKTLLNVLGLRLLGLDWPRVVLSSVALAQVGEFSFVLVGLGLTLGLLDARMSQLLISVTVLSLMVTPLWVATIRKMSTVRTPLKTLGDVWDNLLGSSLRRTRRRLGKAGATASATASATADASARTLRRMRPPPRLPWRRRTGAVAAAAGPKAPGAAVAGTTAETIAAEDRKAPPPDAVDEATTTVPQEEDTPAEAPPAAKKPAPEETRPDA